MNANPSGLISNVLLPPTKAQEQPAFNIEFNFNEDYYLDINVHRVSSSARLAVVADGHEVFSHHFIAGDKDSGDWTQVDWLEQSHIYESISNKNYRAVIPAGTGYVTVKITDGDWLSVNFMKLAAVGGGHDFDIVPNIHITSYPVLDSLMDWDRAGLGQMPELAAELERDTAPEWEQNAGCEAALETDTEPELMPETESQAGTEMDFVLGLEAEPEVHAGTEPEPAFDLEAKPEPATWEARGAELVSDVLQSLESDLIPDPAAEQGVEAEQEADMLPEAEHSTEPDTMPEAEHYTEPDTVPEPKQDFDTIPELASAPEPEPFVPETEPDIIPEAEHDAVPEPEHKPDAIPELMPAPSPGPRVEVVTRPRRLSKPSHKRNTLIIGAAASAITAAAIALVFKRRR